MLDDILVCNVTDRSVPLTCDVIGRLVLPVSDPRVAVWRNIIVVSGGLCVLQLIFLFSP